MNRMSMGKNKNRDRNRTRPISFAIKKGITVRIPPELAFPLPCPLANPVASLEKSASESYTTIAKAFALIATNAWRSRNKIIDSKTGEPREEMKKLYRHIEAIQDALSLADVQTIDTAGRDYDTGMALKVVSFEQTTGLLKEEIKETIKPSVKWQGFLIQMGEVIVGTPKVQNPDSEKEINNEKNDN